MSDREDVVRGQEAERALPVIERAFAKVREALVQKLVGTSPSQRDEILGLHSSIQVIDAAQQAVLGEIGSGHLAQANIDGAARLAANNQG